MLEGVNAHLTLKKIVDRSLEAQTLKRNNHFSDLFGKPKK